MISQSSSLLFNYASFRSVNFGQEAGCVIRMSYSRSVIKNDAGEPIGIDHHYPESEMDRDLDDYGYDAQFDEEEDSDYIECENKKNGMDCFEQNYNNWTESGIQSFEFYCYKNPFFNFGCEPCIEKAETEDWF